MKNFLLILCFILTLVGCNPDISWDAPAMVDLNKTCLVDDSECERLQAEERARLAELKARAGGDEYFGDRYSQLKQCQAADPLLDEVSNLEECERQLAELRAERTAKKRANDARCKAQLGKDQLITCDEEPCDCPLRAENAQARRKKSRR